MACLRPAVTLRSGSHGSDLQPAPPRAESRSLFSGDFLALQSTFLLPYSATDLRRKEIPKRL